MMIKFGILILFGLMLDMDLELGLRAKELDIT